MATSMDSDDARDPVDAPVVASIPGVVLCLQAFDTRQVEGSKLDWLHMYQTPDGPVFSLTEVALLLGTSQRAHALVNLLRKHHKSEGVTRIPVNTGRGKQQVNVASPDTVQQLFALCRTHNVPVATQWWQHTVYPVLSTDVPCGTQNLQKKTTTVVVGEEHAQRESKEDLFIALEDDAEDPARQTENSSLIQSTSNAVVQQAMSVKTRVKVACILSALAFVMISP